MEIQQYKAVRYKKKYPSFLFSTSSAYEVIDEDSTFYSTETKKYTHTHTHTKYINEKLHIN